MVRIKVTKSMYRNTPDLIKLLENQLLMPSGNNVLFMFTNVNIEVEKEVYGRKNRVREVTYITCTLRGYNPSTALVGAYDEYHTRQYLEMYNMELWRNNYLTFKRTWEAMHAHLDEITTPDFVKAEP